MKLLLLLVLAGCGGGILGQVSPHERELYLRCEHAMVPVRCHKCARVSIKRYRDSCEAECTNKAAREYVAYPTFENRQSFLIQNGCPEGVVRGAR
jgi:hypothetical protein